MGKPFATKQYEKYPLDMFVPAPPAEPSDEHAVLGFGLHWSEAIVVSDDCAIESCRGRGVQSPTDSVLFAPLRNREVNDGSEFEKTDALSKFPLPGDQQFSADRVAVLWRTFAVDSRHLWDDHGQPTGSVRLLRKLDLARLRDLLQRWAAHTTRSGPLITADNSEKLAELLHLVGADEDKTETVADALTRLADMVWGYERGPLEQVATELEDVRATGRESRLDTLLSKLQRHLMRVAEAAQMAAEAIQHLD